MVGKGRNVYKSDIVGRRTDCLPTQRVLDSVHAAHHYNKVDLAPSTRGKNGMGLFITLSTLKT